MWIIKAVLGKRSWSQVNSQETKDQNLKRKLSPWPLGRTSQDELEQMCREKAITFLQPFNPQTYIDLNKDLNGDIKICILKQNKTEFQKPALSLFLSNSIGSMGNVTYVITKVVSSLDCHSSIPHHPGPLPCPRSPFLLLALGLVKSSEWDLGNS